MEPLSALNRAQIVDKVMCRFSYVKEYVGFFLLRFFFLPTVSIIPFMITFCCGRYLYNLYSTKCPINGECNDCGPSVKLTIKR